MTFISVSFLIFFIIVTTLYFTIPHKYRWLLLLIASCIFYMSFIPAYILVLFLLITIDFFAGKLIYKSRGIKRSLFLTASILSTVLVLFAFKYYGFFDSTLEGLGIFLHWNLGDKLLKLVLPIGLSFHTFQSLAYVIEVFKGRQKPEKNFGIYALYVMFYPQLMAGPIERPYHMLHQFYEEHEFEYKRVIDGLKLMLWGAFQKVIIADRVANVVNTVYSDLPSYTGLPLIVATVLFALQIFCDFAGYSSMAIGMAQVMGFKLMKNFDRPYFSRSIGEFWRRWHISLSTWFRDYLYIPLGGNRVNKLRWAFNIMVTFVVSGLWHGANWTFVIWGALHGFYLLVQRAMDGLVRVFRKHIRLNEERSVLDNFIQVLITFSLVTFGWIFFRADTLTDALYVVENLFNGLGTQLSSLVGTNVNSVLQILGNNDKVLGLTLYGWAVAFLAITFMASVHLLQFRIKINEKFKKFPLPLRWAIYYIFVFVIFYYATQGKEQFIYFQF